MLGALRLIKETARLGALRLIKEKEKNAMLGVHRLIMDNIEMLEHNLARFSKPLRSLI